MLAVQRGAAKWAGWKVMTNAEIQMAKEIRMTNDKANSGFVIVSSFGFRHSSLVAVGLASLDPPYGEWAKALNGSYFTFPRSGLNLISTVP